MTHSDAADFGLFLEEIGVTQSQMDAAAALMPEPIASNGRYIIKPSGTYGLGCYAADDIEGPIGILRDSQGWHAAGRYINHSPSPNAWPAMEENALVAYGNIPAGEEITLNYRDVRRCIMEDSSNG